MTQSYNGTFQSIMKTAFLGLVIILTIGIIVYLLIWLFGAKKKSEKAIKFGIRNFMISFVLIIFVLAIPIIVNILRNTG